jgi:WD40 repeat protein
MFVPPRVYASFAPQDEAYALAVINGLLARVWEAATGNDVITPIPAMGEFSDVSWSPDGRYLAIGSFDDRVFIVEINSDIIRATWTGEHHPIQAVAWSPTASIVASGDNRPGVYLFDSLSGAGIITYEGNGSGINGLAWSRDGTRIASGSDNRTIQVWRVR